MSTVRIEWFRSETESILQALAKYQATMESQLEAVQTDEQTRIHDWINSLESDRDAESAIAQDEYSWTYDYMFPRSLRYSFISLLFLVLESQLNSLCDDIKKRRKLTTGANELRGATIARSKEYLHKKAGVPSIDEQLWVKVEDLSKVRNCIVHTLGKAELSRDRIRLRELAAKGFGLSISDREFPEPGVLVVTPEYCQQAVFHVQSLFEAIFEAAGVGPAISID